jgi:hypothetical protein
MQQAGQPPKSFVLPIHESPILPPPATVENTTRPLNPPLTNPGTQRYVRPPSEPASAPDLTPTPSQ